MKGNLENEIGTLANLTTTEKSNIVGSINEVNGKIGDNTNLKTEAKTSTVSAINEIVDNNETEKASGTSAFTLDESLTGASLSTFVAIKKNGFAMITFDIGGLTVNANTKLSLGSVASKFKPKYSLVFAGFVGTSTTTGTLTRIVLSSTGELYIYVAGNVSNQALRGTISYSTE